MAPERKLEVQPSKESPKWASSYLVAPMTGIGCHNDEKTEVVTKISATLQVIRNPDEEKFFMTQALIVANDALQVGEVPVGCVIVLRDASATYPPPPFSRSNCTAYDQSPSVIISHGANQVNATRDATRHAEIVAIDRILTHGRSSDQLKVSPEVICKSLEGGEYSQQNHDHWINIPQCKDHWKNSFGWGCGRIYDKDILSQCDLYVTCEPCIMVRQKITLRM